LAERSGMVRDGSIRACRCLLGARLPLPFTGEGWGEGRRGRGVSAPSARPHTPSAPPPSRGAGPSPALRGKGKEEAPRNPSCESLPPPLPFTGEGWGEGRRWRRSLRAFGAPPSAFGTPAFAGAGSSRERGREKQRG